jgi:hypothetical protein
MNKTKKQKGKSQNWLKKAFSRFLWIANTHKEKELRKQFTYLMSGKLYRKQMLKEDKNFIPMKCSKMARKMIRSGRLA